MPRQSEGLTQRPLPGNLYDPAGRPLVPATLLSLQQLAGNSAVSHLLRAAQAHAGRRAALQRAPAAVERTTRFPENFATYEEWLATFASLPTFTSKDQFRAGEPSGGFKVLGDKAASTDPKAPAGSRAPPPINPLPGDKFIDHPTDDWVKANLPPELRETAYRLPADCADIAVILRHVWLFAHHRSERYGRFVVGEVAGETAKARSARVLGDIVGIDTPNVGEMVNPYADDSGAPLRSFAALGPLLHPGDILVWAHHEGPKGKDPDPTRPRSGGHTQTIMSITRKAGKITGISALQGNQPLPKKSGEGLRHTPGRRIEVRGELNLGDLKIPAAKGSKKGPQQVWDFGDGHTTLVVAGPPKSGVRPAAHKEHGVVVRHISDWLPPITSAGRGTLEGLVEAAMREAQTLLERGRAPATVEGEARSVAHAARQRLGVLDVQLAKAKKPPDPSLRDGISATLKVLKTGATSTAPVPAATVFGAVLDAFEGTVPQAGWSDAGASSANAGERMVGGIRRIPLEGLPGGATRAIVALPATVTGGLLALDVLLHFHGRNAKSDRDINVDRIEEQLESSGRRMMAILPQGSSKADFQPLDPDQYIKGVFGKLTTLRIWSSAPLPGSVVLSGHSGGGKAVTDLIGGSTPSAPTKLSEVALFDGINGPEELDVVTAWVRAQLEGALQKLKAPGVFGVPEKEDAVLGGVVRFCASHTGSATAKPSRRIGEYPGLHAGLRKIIDEWFKDHGAELSPSAVVKLRDRFQVIATGGNVHDKIVGAPLAGKPNGGALEAALKSN